ncbi:LOW QUALITY PROTEIN: dynein regulatory complex subunit 2 [Rhynchonycteris naso]
MPKRGKKEMLLSDEKQFLLFQQNLLVEEEIAKKKDLLSQFWKDKLAKEEHNRALNLTKINTQWRTILEVKTRKLQNDIEILSQTFKRVVDCRDSVIKVAKDLSEAKERHAHALCSHLQNTDQLLALQRCELSTLEENYNMELEILTKEFETERKTIIDQNEKEVHYLQDLFMAMEHNHIDCEYESKLVFQSTDYLKNKNLEEEQHFLRLQQGNVVDLWRRFQDAFKNYTDATEDQKIAFETLKVKDTSSKETGAQMRKVERLQGENILQLAEICSKFETDDEKVLPFYSSALTPEKQEEIEKIGPEELTEELAKGKVLAPEALAQVTADYTGMENFWKGYHKVKLEQSRLQRRHARLLGINGKLREMLKQHLNGISSVNDEVLSQLNPPFTVNYQSNLPQLSSTPKPQPGEKTAHIIEAAHVTSHIL